MLILLAILATSLVVFIIVLLFEGFSFGRGEKSGQQNFQAIESNITNDNVFVSDLFEKSKEKAPEKIQVSNDAAGSYEKDCVLWGDELKEGTVNTDTVCVKE